MPIYNFKDETNDVEFEEMMSISDKEAFLLDNPHIRQLPPTRVNVQYRSTYSGIVNDGGWNEQMSRIAEAHPTSEVANKYGDKSVKAVKTRQAVEKWKAKRATDPNR